MNPILQCDIYETHKGTIDLTLRKVLQNYGAIDCLVTFNRISNMQKK